MPVIVEPKLRPAYIATYNAIREAITVHGVSPSLRELMAGLGVSQTTVIAAIKELKKRGHITQEKFAARSIRLVDPERILSKTPVDPWDEDLDTPRIWKEE